MYTTLEYITSIVNCYMDSNPLSFDDCWIIKKALRMLIRSLIKRYKKPVLAYCKAVIYKIKIIFGKVF